MEQDDYLWKNLGRKEPRQYGEPEDLSDDGRDAEKVQSVSVSPRIEVLAYGEAHYEQGDQLGDNHSGKDLNAHRLPETPFVYEHLGDYPEAGQGQHPGQSQGLGEVEAQLQIEDDIGSDRQRHQ